MNTAIGTSALGLNTTGSDNTATGPFALHDNTNGSNNTAYGEQALFNNTSDAQNTATGTVALFSNTTAEYNTGLVTKPFLTTPPASKTPRPVPVRSSTTAQPQTIRPPVSRRFLTTPPSVRYDQVNTMLLNEFLEQHRKVEEQQATIAELKSTVAQQRKDSEATAAQLQKEIEILTTTVKQRTSKIRMVSPQLAAESPSLAHLK
jgi:uncharacterized coiled-coil protein SlyX